ncbi:TetR/AcrR family transcriptional regulator [Rivularia sp. PCC 7116]|uniref:TetR/AcrR family transcriptional regulator n=1 Tax=Rivularia sp. PCC 7116 TaxID=373994 RepID=UPI00031EF455|nr:TetR/AcrR family transcriptional regulator [Rivularia sp. PCC 7116]
MSIRHRMVENKENIKLGRKDWIEQGLKVLGESGVEALRVEPLAKLMNVTKGSFYWHFKNRQELLDALLQQWVNSQTEGIIQQVDEKDGDAETKLMHLFELAIEDDGKVENAIRAWATNDVKAASILESVDLHRLEYTRDLFVQVGFTGIDAMVRARMAYYTLVVGEFTVGTRMNQNQRLLEARLQHTILTRRN